MADDQKKTKQELIAELNSLRQQLAAARRQISTLEHSQAEYQQTAASLRESYERYRSIVELAPDGIITTNLRGVATSCNSAFLKLTGYNKDEIVGTHISRLPTLRIEDVARYTKLLFSILRGEPVKPFDFRWVHKDGTTRWGEAHVGVMKRESKTIGLQAFLRDITERVRAREELEDERAFLSGILNSIEEAIVICDDEGRLIRFNDAARRLHGLPEEPILPSRWAEHYNLLQMDGTTPLPVEEIPLFRALQGEQVRNAEIVVDPQRGDPRYMVCNGQLLTDERGQTIGAVVAMHDVTERKHMEEALRMSEERFRDLVEHSFDLICTHDLQGRLLSVNPAAARAYGYTADELLGMNLRDLLAPEVRHQFDDYLAEIETEGEASGLMLVVNRHGERFVWEYHNSLRVEGVPQPIVRGTARDITERRRVEEALRDREDRLSKTMLAANDGMWDWDLQTDDVYFDPRYYTMAGYEVDEFRHRLEEFQKRVHPHDIDAVMEEARKHLAGEIDRFVVEFRFKKKSGGWLWILGRGVIVERGGEGVPLRFVGTHTNITERKWAEKALARSNNMLEIMLQNMPGGMLLIGEDHRIRQVNARTCDITGYSQEELVGELCDVVCTTGSAARACPILEQGADRFTGVDTVVRCKDGERHPALKNAQRIVIGGETYVLEIFQDIAKLKEMEEELRQQERLATVGQLAAGIAHDFRNLLAAIVLYAQMDLHAPDLPPGVASHLRIIVEESNKATELVQQILDFSSRAMIDRQILDLGAWLAQTLQVLRRTIPENVRISLEREPGVDDAALTVSADPGRLQQALVNLALNARDAMPKGGHLRLELSRLELAADEMPPVAEMKPGAWICLTVSDTGVGMTNDVQKHLFEPFFTTKEVGQGTGLGLAQVYGIIRQHGGAIDVETVLGEGTTFRLYLPAEDVEPEPEAAADASNSARLRGRGETVLLVEDSQALRAAAEAILESLDYQVLTATDGREALDRYRAHGGVDLIITDLVMPNLGGEELMQALTSRRGQPDAACDIPAVGITGYAVEDVTAELRDVGFVDLIQKPFGRDELARVVRRALDQRESR